MTEGTKPGERWWHYTTALILVQIIASTRIARAGAGVMRGERKAVWFSRRVTWEPTARKLFVDAEGNLRGATVPEMIAKHGLLVRLEVSTTVARHRWADHRRMGQIDPRIADGLE